MATLDVEDERIGAFDQKQIHVFERVGEALRPLF